MAILVANNATSYLAGTLTAVATSLTVSSGTGTLFPTISGSDVFYVTLTNTSNQNEIVRVTGTATDTFTIVRAQDGTTAKAFAIGDKVELRVIKVVFDDKASLTNNQTFSGENTFSGSTTADLVRITQTGTGNAFVVEDSANPDTTPFVINGSGLVGIGTTTPTSTLHVVGFATLGPAGGEGGHLIIQNPDTSNGMNIDVSTANKGRVYGSNNNFTLQLGQLGGTDGLIQFYTEAAERMRITADGNVGIGITTITNTTLRLSKNITGATTAQGIRVDGAIQTDVTGQTAYFQAVPAMASGTLNNLYSFDANQGTIGATVTNQVGFRSGTTSIGATNNFGFYAGDTQAVTAGKTAYGYYSDIDIATGGGTTYGFYGAGTANNFFNGRVGIGSTALTNIGLRISKPITGNATSFGVYSDGQIQPDVTSTGTYFATSAGATSGTLGTIYHYRAAQASLGTATFATQIGFVADDTLIGATANYGFVAENTAAVTAGKTAIGYYSAVNTATGGGTTYGFYANGTAPNYFAGNVGIGEPNPTRKLDVVGTASATYFNLGANTVSTPAVDAAITRPANGSLALITNAAERMRLDASGNIGIGTTAPQGKLSVSNNNASTLEFFVTYPGGGVGTYIQSFDRTGSAYVSTAYDATDHSFRTSGTERMRIDSSGVLARYQPAQTSKSAAATLTAAELQTRIIQYTGAAATLTLPTGTNLEGVVANLAVNMAFEVTFINTGAALLTIGANANTTVGTLTVATLTSATFRFRKTAANTFTIYRL